ncbi:sulfotransferase 1 family member D1 [Stomoxys calcitrans]|uniref:sulfotransferase 1 family member D1 n=1 Tax=Stomoxys calcitrans TaxID=35570 RepID=UPI0027E2779F|nr:sulfotransferase 1 family member D1 [Stomoxys calcitrans]
MIQSNEDLITKSITAERSPYPMKQYATNGCNVPLSKNWLDSWCSMPAHSQTVLKDLLNYNVRSDDIFVVTFMKSGTTWMQEAVWLLMNNLDFKQSNQLSITQRSPFLELQAISPYFPSPMELSKKLSSPRVLKSHMPPNLLPRKLWSSKGKIIYVARNCKDVVVSSYHFCKNVGTWIGNNFEDYAQDFMNDEVISCPYWSHLIDFWKMRHEPHICFVTYEEMKKDMRGVIVRLCEFLERPQLAPEDMEKLLEHLSFSNMKDNKQVNLTSEIKQLSKEVKDEFEFMRRGIVGSFKDEMTPELQAKINKWSEDILVQHGLSEEEIFGSL